MDENKAICSRCGSTWTINAQKRNRTDLRCFSCRMRKSLVIKYGSQKCVTWQGEFDRETLTVPMHEGRPVLPGLRKCGHIDCVNAEHVIQLDD